MRRNAKSRDPKAAVANGGRPFGPYPLESDGKSVKLPVRDKARWVYVRVDAEQMGIVLAHRWRIARGYPTTTVFAVATKTATHLQLHRLLTNAPKGVVVDHRRGNKLDCRRCMLRFATFSQNAANTRLNRRGRLSRFRGVTLHKQTRKWQAQAEHRGRFVNGGLHATEEAAALKYNQMAKRIWGPFARINRVRPTRRKRVAVQLPLAIAADHSTPTHRGRAA